MPRIFNSPHLLFSNFSTGFPAQLSHSLYSSTWKPSFPHLAHTRGKVHVRPSSLYLISLPCPSCWPVENLAQIGCCFKKWDSASTSTIYASVVSFEVIKVFFVHCQGCLSGDLSTNIQELTTSRCSIFRTMWTDALVDHGELPLQSAMTSSCSSCCIPTVNYWVSWRPFTAICIYSHPNAYCF